MIYVIPAWFENFQKSIFVWSLKEWKSFLQRSYHDKYHKWESNHTIGGISELPGNWSTISQGNWLHVRPPSLHMENLIPAAALLLWTSAFTCTPKFHHSARAK